MLNNPENSPLVSTKSKCYIMKSKENRENSRQFIKQILITKNKTPEQKIIKKIPTKNSLKNDTMNSKENAFRKMTSLKDQNKKEQVLNKDLTFEQRDIKIF